MATSTQVTVGTTPILLYQANGPQSETVFIDNHGTATITLGGPNVVAGAGVQIAAANPTLAFPMNEDSLYAVVATGSATVEILSVLH